jgi:hypothetical protein
MKLTWPAPERNKGPILEVLKRVLPEHGTLLELASGSGQHVVHFARNFPEITFLPSDIIDENLASIRAWIDESGLTNVLPPRRIDVTSSDFDIEPVDAIYNANMVHISPWSCAIGLFAGAARYLAEAGSVVLYGPFRIGGEHSAPSNAEFDADLRSRDASWGVRDFEAIVTLAENVGLRLRERVAMPANNQTLVFVR